MAYTNLHAITQTVSLAIDYAMSDKVESVLKDDVADCINYAVNDKTGEVTYYTLSSTLWCSNPQRPVESFYALINTFGAYEVLNGNNKTKDGKPILAWHLKQSFDGQEVTPTVANEIGRKLAEEVFPNFPSVVATHTNTGNIHNHIVFCAWDLDGKKYNNDHAAYRKIRSTSDRLCKEYGLSVMEHTRNHKLVQWKDNEGNIHYYEPTDRKNEMIRKRKDGELTTDDVNSYRNTTQYEVATAKKETNVAIVKQAIDDKLPYATSYEHLLSMLREMGFTVKDKKKNGDWLAHITFTPPTAEKGVRDSSIDKESGYYIRENLTAVIEQQNAERRRNESAKSQLHIPYYSEYVYGEIDVQSIDENYRADLAPGGEIKIVKRGEAEKSIIRDVKKSDMELYGLYDTTTLRRLIAQEREARKHKRPPQKREEVLIRQIQDGFENLRFIEQKQLYSYGQINEIVRGLWGQYNACLSKISEAEAMVEKLETVAKTPHTLNEVRKRMEQGKDNPEYMIEHYHQDAKLMRSCMEAMKKYNITDTESLKALQSSTQKYREQITKLQTMLSGFSAELSAYNRCVATLARIDRDSGRENNELLINYENIVRNAQQEAEQTNEKRKERGHNRE